MSLKQSVPLVIEIYFDINVNRPSIEHRQLLVISHLMLKHYLHCLWTYNINELHMTLYALSWFPAIKLWPRRRQNILQAGIRFLFRKHIKLILWCGSMTALWREFLDNIPCPVQKRNVFIIETILKIVKKISIHRMSVGKVSCCHEGCQVNLQKNLLVLLLLTKSTKYGNSLDIFYGHFWKIPFSKIFYYCNICYCSYFSSYWFDTE